MSFDPVFKSTAQYTMLAGLIGYFDKLVLLDTNGDPISGQETSLDIDITQDGNPAPPAPDTDHIHLSTGFVLNLTPDAAVDLPAVTGNVTIYGVGIIDTNGDVILSKALSNPISLGDAQYLTIPQNYYLTVAITPNNEL